MTPRHRGVRFSLSVLQVHIDGRQRHDRNFGFRDKIERAVHFAFRLVGQTATVPAHHAALVAIPHRRAGNVGQRRRERIVSLVDMQINIEVVTRCQRKDAIKQHINIVERCTMIAD